MQPHGFGAWLLASCSPSAGGRLAVAIKGVAAAQGLDIKHMATPAAIKQLQPTAGTLTAAGKQQKILCCVKTSVKACGHVVVADNVLVSLAAPWSVGC